MASVFKLIYVPLKIRYIFTILKKKNLYHNVEQTKKTGVLGNLTHQMDIKYQKEQVLHRC